MTTMEKYRYIGCRSFGHSWVPREIIRTPGGYKVQIQCSQCTMLRQDEVNQRGEVERRHYVQPEEYANPDIIERTKYRRELLRRAIKETE